MLPINFLQNIISSFNTVATEQLDLITNQSGLIFKLQALWVVRKFECLDNITDIIANIPACKKLRSKKLPIGILFFKSCLKNRLEPVFISAIDKSLS